MSSKMFVTVFIMIVFTATSLGLPEGANDEQPVSQEEIRKYLAMMEKVDVDQVMNNTRLLNNNIKCFLNEGPCTAQFKDLKKVLPKLIKDSCATCTKNQKEIVKKSIEGMKAARPNDYERLSKMYDPNGEYTKKFMENLKNQ